MKPNIELIKNLVIDVLYIAVYYNYMIFPNIACKNWRSKTTMRFVFFGEFLCVENAIKDLGITEAIWMKDSRI